MWPTGILKDLLFFAMMTHLLGYKLISTQYKLRWHRNGLHPNIMHTSDIRMRTYTHKIHHWVLPVTSCLEGKSCHSNKPQKRKFGCQVATLVSQCLKKYCNVGTQTRQIEIMFICFINVLQASLSIWQSAALFSVEFFNTSKTNLTETNLMRH